MENDLHLFNKEKPNFKAEKTNIEIDYFTANRKLKELKENISLQIGKLDLSSAVNKDKKSFSGRWFWYV